MKPIHCLLGWHRWDANSEPVKCVHCGADQPRPPTRQEQRHEELRRRQWDWLTKPWGPK